MSVRVQLALWVSVCVLFMLVAWPFEVPLPPTDRDSHPGIVRLHKQPHLIAVGGGSRGDCIKDASVILDLPHREVSVIEVDADRGAAYLKRLRGQESLRFVQPVFTTDPDDERSATYIPTDKIVLQLREAIPAVSMENLASSVGCGVIGAIDWLDGGWVLQLPIDADSAEIAVELAAHHAVVWAHPDWLMKLGERENIPNDPLFGNQWHLKNTGQGGGLPGADIKATFAWDLATGSGMTIAVIDSGVEPAHNDLTQTPMGYHASLGAGPGIAADSSGHGTSVAGVAAGTGNNGILLTGVARDATIMPICLLDAVGYGTALEQANCIAYAVNSGADVITNSWGPDGVPFLLPGVVQSSFIFAVTTGRGGRGCPIFWAANAS